MAIFTGTINGWAFGPSGPGHLVSLAGLTDLPSVTTHDEPLPGGGVAPGYDQIGGREISATFGFAATSETDMVAQVATFSGAVASDPSELIDFVFTLVGIGTFTIPVKVRSRVVHYDLSAAWKTCEVDVVLFAPDPAFTPVGSS